VTQKIISRQKKLFLQKIYPPRCPLSNVCNFGKKIFLTHRGDPSQTTTDSAQAHCHDNVENTTTMSIFTFFVERKHDIVGKISMSVNWHCRYIVMPTMSRRGTEKCQQCHDIVRSWNMPLMIIVFSLLTHRFVKRNFTGSNAATRRALIQQMNRNPIIQVGTGKYVQSFCGVVVRFKIETRVGRARAPGRAQARKPDHYSGLESPIGSGGLIFSGFGLRGREPVGLSGLNIYPILLIFSRF
jgi:hypothetical protein